MKISLGAKPRSGPWGGGNQFVIAFVEYLKARGDEVVFDLNDPDIDLLFLFDPLKGSANATFQYREIINYLLNVNPEALVVHRVNECDERKGTTGVNAQLIKGNFCADHTIFISGWLRDLLLAQGFDTPSLNVVFNGADTRVFNSQGYSFPGPGEKIRFVTHHWGANRMKGFDVYERLDDMIGATDLGEKIEFCYIGNLPEGFTFKHTRTLPPTSGAELADLIRKNHIYITASQNEPAGMHHVEAGNCGLPLLFRESGALPEYCEGFGVSFNAENFPERLEKILNEYPSFAKKIKDYPNTAERMCEGYYNTIQDVLANKERLLAYRQKRNGVWKRHNAYYRLRRASGNILRRFGILPELKYR